MKSIDTKTLDAFEKKIGYKFKDRALLVTALTHSSFANESHGRAQSYERLEFLGDSILGFVTAEFLYGTFPELPEGKLTKKRASLVCEKSLCGFTRSFGAGELLRLSHGEQHSEMCIRDRCCTQPNVPTASKRTSRRCFRIRRTRRGSSASAG